jgi:hypothetical protein
VSNKALELFVTFGIGGHIVESVGGRATCDAYKPSVHRFDERAPAIERKA